MQEQSSTSTGPTCDDMTTCGRSRQHTHTHRISASISSAAASPAKTSALQAREQDSQARGPVFGTILLGSFAQFDPDGWSSKTSQLSLLEGSEPFLETWPKSGLMRNGIAYRLQRLVLRTKESGSGSLPFGTPTANEVICNASPTPRMGERFRRRHGGNLLESVAHHMWPTPKASAAGPDFAKTTRSKTEISLATAVAMFPTPAATDGKGAGKTGTLRDRVDYAAERGATKSKTYQQPPQDGGSLNPTWVEWLMGFPLGWTALDASATPSSRKSSKSSGGQSLQRKRG